MNVANSRTSTTPVAPTDENNEASQPRSKRLKEKSLIKKTSGAWYVLVGGEAYESHGVPQGRELMHTSLKFVADAYTSLRKAGVPRERIITIVQAKDYLNGLGMSDTAYPKSVFVSSCQTLIAEGGADYDYHMVNPHTIWSVLLGKQSERIAKVVPTNATSVMFAIYSHGDSHPVKQGDKERGSLDPLRHEWYCHLPYPSPKTVLTGQMLEFVATDGARQAGFGRSRPQCYLYATQLRTVFAQMFQRNPTRPVVALLNYCRSGGGLSFMRRDAARRALGVDKWPLFLMSSCQANKDALVGGLWEQWFGLLCASLSKANGNRTQTQSRERACRVRKRSRTEHQSKNTATSLEALYQEAATQYYIKNKYELKDYVKTHAYASNCGTRYESFDRDLSSLVCAAPGGLPDYVGIARLQKAYRDGTRYKGFCKAKIWDPNDWGGKEVSLVEAVKRSRKQIAQPEAVWGAELMKDLSLMELFQGTDQIQLVS